MSEIQGREFNEFRHMFELGYIREDFKEIVQELIDYIGDDGCAAYQIDLLEMENDRDQLQKDVDLITNELRDEFNKNSDLREQLRQLTNAISDLTETSRELVDRRVAMRNY